MTPHSASIALNVSGSSMEHWILFIRNATLIITMANVAPKCAQKKLIRKYRSQMASHEAQQVADQYSTSKDETEM